MKQIQIRSSSQVERPGVNDKLMSQVSHIVGHRISGPIATMLGLIELIKMNRNHQEEICPLVGHLEECVLRLKDNCKELGDLVYHDRSNESTD
jgi:hypothetical protein